MSAPKPVRRWFRRPFPLLGMGFGLALGTGAFGLIDHSVSRLVEPRQYEAEDWMNAMTAQPEKSGFHLRSFVVETEDHLKLQAMLVTPAPTAGTTARGQRIVAGLKNAGVRSVSGVRGTIVFLHGFNARKEHMLPFAERFCAAGFRCVIFDSRGHGDSGGHYATFGQRESDDLKRVLAATRQAGGTEELGPVGLLGYSMGGAVALQTQPFLPEVRAVASVSAFAGFGDIVEGQAAMRYHAVGTALLPLIRQGTAWRAGFDPWEISPEAAMARVTCPVFLAHGAEDALIPVAHVHRLAGAGGTRVKQVMVIPEGTHGSVFSVGGDDLWNAMALFMVKSLEARVPG